MFSFFGKKKKPVAKTMLKPQAAAGQKRTAFRMPVEFDVIYTLSGRPGRRRARANDLSAAQTPQSHGDQFRTPDAAGSSERKRSPSSHPAASASSRLAQRRSSLILASLPCSDARVPSMIIVSPAK